MEEANLTQEKCTKYQELVEKSREGGRKTHYEQIEIICTPLLLLNQLGLTGVAKKRAIQSLC